MITHLTRDQIITSLLDLVGAKKDEGGNITYRRGKRFKISMFEDSELGRYVVSDIEYINSLDLGAKITSRFSSKIVSLWLNKQGVFLRKITVRKKGENNFDRKYMIKRQ